MCENSLILGPHHQNSTQISLLENGRSVICKLLWVSSIKRAFRELTRLHLKRIGLPEIQSTNPSMGSKTYHVNCALGTGSVLNLWKKTCCVQSSAQKSAAGTIKRQRTKYQAWLSLIHSQTLPAPSSHSCSSCFLSWWRSCCFSFPRSFSFVCFSLSCAQSISDAEK